MTETPKRRNVYVTVLKLAVRLIVAALVVWGIYHAIHKANREMAERQYRDRDDRYR